MQQTALLATTALACLVLALGCERGTNPADPPLKTIERTTNIWAPPSNHHVRDSEPKSAPKPAQAEPAMSTPPDEALDAPTESRELIPVAPSKAPSEHEDGCGRPLVT